MRKSSTSARRHRTRRERLFLSRCYLLDKMLLLRRNYLPDRNYDVSGTCDGEGANDEYFHAGTRFVLAAAGTARSIAQ